MKFLEHRSIPGTMTNKRNKLLTAKNYVELNLYDTSYKDSGFTVNNDGMRHTPRGKRKLPSKRLLLYSADIY